jgi:hypothetical protein
VSLLSWGSLYGDALRGRAAGTALRDALRGRERHSHTER